MLPRLGRAVEEQQTRGEEAEAVIEGVVEAEVGVGGMLMVRAALVVIGLKVTEPEAPTHPPRPRCPMTSPQPLVLCRRADVRLPQLGLRVEVATRTMRM